jgi:hypothetical protein
MQSSPASFNTATDFASVVGGAPMSRFYAAVATISWIDPKSGLPEYDSQAPGDLIPQSTIFARTGYRFSHYLEGGVEVNSAGAITDAVITPESGLYRAPSMWGTKSVQVGEVGQKITNTRKSVTFRQIVGCRTLAPQVIGGAVAEVSSGLLTLPFAWEFGEEAASLVKIFPPIWTELELTINIDGSFSHKLLRHSLFPSVSYYAQVPPPPPVPTAFGNIQTNEAYQLVQTYDGVPNLNLWYQGGWGPLTPPTQSYGEMAGNPWSMTKPSTQMIDTMAGLPPFHGMDILYPVPQGYAEQPTTSGM